MNIRNSACLGGTLNEWQTSSLEETLHLKELHTSCLEETLHLKELHFVKRNDSSYMRKKKNFKCEENFQM